MTKDALRTGLVEDIGITTVRMRRNFSVICRKELARLGHWAGRRTQVSLVAT